MNVYGIMILTATTRIMNKILILFLSLCLSYVSKADNIENLSLKNLTTKLNTCKYAQKVAELDKKNIPYILTESIWSNVSYDIKAVIILPEKVDFNCSNIICTNIEKNTQDFKQDVVVLLSLAKKLPKGLLSGINLVKNSARSLPFVLTRIIIYDGKDKVSILLNEIAYVWNIRNNPVKSHEVDIKNINNFLRTYIFIVEKFDPVCNRALNCFFPPLDSNFE